MTAMRAIKWLRDASQFVLVLPLILAATFLVLWIELSGGRADEDQGDW